MKALFLCNTPYQIIVTTQIAQTRLKNYQIDIIISDHIAKPENLIRNIKNSRFFDNVFFYTPRKHFCNKPRYRYYFEYLKQLFFRKYFWDDEMKIHPEYDEFYFVMPTFEANMIARCIKNKKLKIFMFEDGFASYTNLYGNIIKKLYRNDVLKLYRKIFYSELYKIEGIYVFNPKYMEWNASFPILNIEKIQKKHVLVLNEVFGYENLENEYNKDIIFFEESYYRDGIFIGDEELISIIAEKIGKDSLMVKIHPRNPYNRFLKMGLKTNTNTAIPWEIIALNIDISSKILVTVASGSALTSLLNTNMIPKKVVMLMNCREVKDINLTSTVSLLRRIADRNQEVVILPNNYENAILTIQSLAKDG